MNAGVADPVAHALNHWFGSGLHRGILSDGSYGRIGCEEAVDDGVHWFACVLATGPLPAQAGSAAGLPDTSLELPSTPATASRWRSCPTRSACSPAGLSDTSWPMLPPAGT